jgi:DNA invertase Pin-like site-specific DNA recombinase
MIKVSLVRSGRTTMNAKRAGIYARVSTNDQSIENQLGALRAAVEHRGWAVAAELVDRGISGAKSREDRPQFDSLLRAVARRKIDVVAAWSVGRLRSHPERLGRIS